MRGINHKAADKECAPKWKKFKSDEKNNDSSYGTEERLNPLDCYIGEYEAGS